MVQEINIKVLLVKHNQDLFLPITKCFESENIRHTCTCSASEALEELKNETYDFILLENQLPEYSALIFIKQLNLQRFKGNVLIVAKNATDEEIVNSITYGSDDVFTAPFNTNLILARLKSLYRLRFGNVSQNYYFGEIEINPTEYKVWVNKNRLTLTKTEFEILNFLIFNPDKIVPHEVIAKQALNLLPSEIGEDYAFLYSHLKNLKRKIGQHSSFNYIKTVYGQGYRFCSFIPLTENKTEL